MSDVTTYMYVTEYNQFDNFSVTKLIHISSDCLRDFFLFELAVAENN